MSRLGFADSVPVGFRGGDLSGDEGHLSELYQLAGGIDVILDQRGGLASQSVSQVVQRSGIDHRDDLFDQSGLFDGDLHCPGGELSGESFQVAVCDSVDLAGLSSDRNGQGESFSVWSGGADRIPFSGCYGEDELASGCFEHSSRVGIGRGRDGSPRRFAGLDPR